jgi:hypothetical protein
MGATLLRLIPWALASRRGWGYVIYPDWNLAVQYRGADNTSSMLISIWGSGTLPESESTQYHCPESNEFIKLWSGEVQISAQHWLGLGKQSNNKGN